MELRVLSMQWVLFTIYIQLTITQKHERLFFAKGGRMRKTVNVKKGNQKKTLQLNTWLTL